MKKPAVLAVFCLLIIFVSLSTIQIVVVSGAYPLSMGVYIESPLNGTIYNSSAVTLKFSSAGMFTDTQRSCIYTLDGVSGGSVTLRNSVDKFGFFGTAKGAVILNNLKDGEHSVSVTLTTTSRIETSLDTSTATFFVYTQPILSNTTSLNQNSSQPVITAEPPSVQEFPTSIILAPFMMATVLMALVYFKKRKR